MHPVLRAHPAQVVTPVLAVDYGPQVNLEVELDLAECDGLHVAEL